MKGRLDNIGVPFAQLCEKAAVNVLQVYSPQIVGERA